MEGRLGYNNELERYGVLVSELWKKDGLHCGECFDIFINGEWISDRIEYNHKIKNWYLVKSKLVGEELEYLRVRI